MFHKHFWGLAVILLWSSVVLAQEDQTTTLRSLWQVPAITTYDIDFCPNETCLALTTFDSQQLKIVVLDVRTGEVLQELVYDSPIGEILAFSPDGSQLAIFSNQEKIIVVWNLATNTTWTMPTGEVETILWNHSGTKLLVSGFEPNTTTIWDIVTQEISITVPGRARWTENEHYLCSFSENTDYIDIYSGNNLDQLQQLELRDVVVGYYCLNDYLIVFGEEEAIVFDIHSLSEINRVNGIQSFPVLTSSVSKLQFFKDNAWQIWNISTNSSLFVFPQDVDHLLLPPMWNTTEDLFVVDSRLSSCTKNCAYTTQVWDITSNTILATQEFEIKPYSSWLSSESILSRTNSTTWQIWNGLTSEILYELPHSEQLLETVKIDTTGNQIVTITGDTIYFWNIHSLQH